MNRVTKEIKLGVQLHSDNDREWELRVKAIKSIQRSVGELAIIVDTLFDRAVNNVLENGSESEIDEMNQMLEKNQEDIKKFKECVDLVKKDNQEKECK